MYATLLLVMLLPGVWQENPENTAYRQDYARYTDISAIEDLAERATQFMDFQAEGFDSRLDAYVHEGIFEALLGLYEGGSVDALFPLVDRWKESTGDSRAVALGFQAAAESGDHQNTVKYGAEFYQENPSGEIAQVLATSYKEVGDSAQYARHVEDAINAMGIAANFPFAYDMFADALESRDWAAAAGWAQRIRSEVPSAPEGISAADWAEIQVEFQSTIARSEFEAGNHRQAIAAYQRLIEMDREQRAMAYLYIGRSSVEIGAYADALNAAANSYVLNDPVYSDAAQAFVLQIYRDNTGGTTEGLEENVLGPARRRMAR
jgi:tetratricopeptide (TPR) repeat protein